jgi:hypothetical protein
MGCPFGVLISKLNAAGTGIEDGISESVVSS